MMNRFNIVHKLIGYLIVVSVLPLLIFAVISYGVVRDSIIELSSENSTDQINSQRDYLEQLVVQQVENLSARIVANDSITAILSKPFEPGATKPSVFDELSSQEQIRLNMTLFGHLKGIVSIDIIGADGHRYYVGDTLTVSPLTAAHREAMISQALADPEPVHWLGVVDNLNTASPSRKVLSATRVMHRYFSSRRTTEVIGLLVIDYSTDALREHFRLTDLGRSSSIYVLDGDNRMICAPDAAQTGLPAPAQLVQQLKVLGGRGMATWDGVQSLITSAKLNGDVWTVIGVIPKDHLQAPMRRLAQVLTSLIVLSFLLIALASRFFQRTMVMPIQAISDGFRALFDRHAGHAEPLPVPNTDDEISELVRWYNTFLETHAMRQKAEQELADSQYKFSSIFKQAPLPLALVRIETGQFVDVNDSWLAQFGYDRDEIIGNSSLDLNLWIDLADRKNVLDRIDESLIVNRLEIRQRTKDGRVLICQMSGRPFYYQSVMHFIFSPVDITRQRQTEIEINELNQQLESRVQSRTELLHKSNLELNKVLDTLNLTQSELVRSEKLAALGSLVAGVAHEINTPVGIIVTSASVLNDASKTLHERFESGPIRKSQVEEYVRVALESSGLIIANANRAAHLIQSFKQVAVDQTSEQRRQFDLNTFVADLVASLHPSLKKSRISIQLQASTTSITMDSYPGLLAQVLTNLTMNALMHAFGQRGDGHILIELRLDDDKDLVEICFGDDGTGIQEAILDRIFDPFFTTRRGQGGTGLGLNIVFNIINKQLGGTIVAQNRTTGGALFIMTIPRTTRELTEKEYIRDALS